MNRIPIPEGNYLKAVKHLIVRALNSHGGFREKDVWARNPTIEYTETWNREHRVVNVIAEADGFNERKSFEFDLVTGLFC